MRIIRYDELKKNDVILFHGANVKITKVMEFQDHSNEFYPEEKTITFDIEPADEDALDILGNFYSHGTYGGVGCLSACLVNRA